MKLLHTSDLHIGKRVNEFSMLEDQEYILKQILEIIKKHKIEGVILAGDIYDRSVPSVAAVEMADDFLTSLSLLCDFVCLVSGNHDSGERLDFGGQLFKKHGIHIAGEYKGVIPKVTIADEHGPLNLFLCPYLRPGKVNRELGATTSSYSDCVQEALKDIAINEKERNLCVAHQFVTGMGVELERAESEVVSVGGSDQVDVSIFDAFDYVALGHLHMPQRISRETIRYSGSPLSYSFSECGRDKHVVILDWKEKDNLSISFEKLVPKKGMFRLRGTLEEIEQVSKKEVPRDSYVQITLTDEEEIIDAISKVRRIFPNVMVLDFDNKRRSGQADLSGLSIKDIKTKSTIDLFADFYAEQNGQTSLNENQRKLLKGVLEGMVDTDGEVLS